MEKFIKTFFSILVLSIILTNNSYCQTLSESDIKTIAEKINRKVKGVDVGNGVTAIGCFAFGRTLMFKYEVPINSQVHNILKKDLITNLKTSGDAKTFYLNKINVDFYYFEGNSLVKKISINSNELSTFSLELGEYLSIEDHPKAKDVNLKIKVPIGWEINEGNRPNIVKKFENNGNTYLILIKENMTFFSRNEAEDLLQDESFLNEFVQETRSFLNNAVVLDQSVLSLDTYPAMQFKVKGNIERSGVTMSVIMKSWVIFYEDKIIFLQCSGMNKAEFKALEPLYFLITNSVIFPEQYD